MSENLTSERDLVVGALQADVVRVAGAMTGSQPMAMSNERLADQLEDLARRLRESPVRLPVTVLNAQAHQAELQDQRVQASRRGSGRPRKRHVSGGAR